MLCASKNRRQVSSLRQASARRIYPMGRKVYWCRPSKSRKQPGCSPLDTRPSVIERPTHDDWRAVMDLGLTGKRALVTGSTAGIGFATARALANEGAHVTVNGRTEARVGDAVDQLRGRLPNGTVDGIVADLGNG